ncbi:MAG: hypothetical protein IKF19_02150 [Bacilli bacterium]|nr:hypothetical protein [Bacilli bacterium]
MDIKIINGNGDYVKEAIDKTMEAAVNYYGEKYRNIIEKTVMETLYYEWEDRQTESDVIFDISNGTVDIQVEEDDGYESCAFYYLNLKENNEFDRVVVFRNEYLKDSYHSLVHELFGHGVFGYVDPIFSDEDQLFERNGIAYIDCKNNYVYNEVLNEGFVEDATLNIMQLADLKPLWLEPYFKTKQAASVIRRNIGHEKLYDFLIEDKGIIYDLYNLNSIGNKDEFFELSMLLDDSFYFDVGPRYNKLFNNNLKRFIKRSRTIR